MTTLLRLCNLIETGYADGKSGLDDDMLDHLIDLGDQTQAIRALIAQRDALRAVLSDARDAWLNDRLDDVGGILTGDVCSDALEATQ